MDTVALQKVTTSATDIAKSVVQGQVEIFDIYAKNCEGMPISSFFSAAATMQRAHLQGIDNLSDILSAAPAKEKSKAKASAPIAPKGKKAAATPTTDDVDVTVAFDDLTIITGVGPSTMKKLQTQGIRTFFDLAKISSKDLATIIETANIRMLKNTPSDWIDEAKQLVKSAKAA